MKDMRNNSVDFVTIGQYLQPSKGHQELKKYYTLEEFKELEKKHGSMVFQWCLVLL